MIDPKELRIGNYFSNTVNPPAVILRVTGLSEDTISGKTIDGKFNGMFSQYNISGIPLTEEWLLKFGFSDERSGIFRNYYIIKFFSDWSDREERFELCITRHNSKDADITFGILRDEDSDKDESLISWMGIMHVHQLQNLYFALTGEELVCK